ARAQVGARARLPPDQGTVGLRGPPHRRALRLRVARRRRPLVPQLRQRELGDRRRWPDDAPLRQHQRPADHGKRAQVLLAAGPPARWASGAERAGTMSATEGYPELVGGRAGAYRLANW